MLEPAQRSIRKMHVALQWTVRFHSKHAFTNVVVFVQCEKEILHGMPIAAFAVYGDCEYSETGPGLYVCVHGVRNRLPQTPSAVGHVGHRVAGIQSRHRPFVGTQSNLPFFTAPAFVVTQTEASVSRLRIEGLESLVVCRSRHTERPCPFP